jgi:hypothetical protein
MPSLGSLVAPALFLDFSYRKAELGSWRVFIAKPGTTKQRPLSIPTVTAYCAVALVW